jgi:hypothetical protein
MRKALTEKGGREIKERKILFSSSSLMDHALVII